MKTGERRPFLKRNEAAALAILVLVGIILFFLFSGNENAGENKITPPPKPNPLRMSESISQSFLANQTLLSLLRNVTLSPYGNKSAYRDEISLANSGNSPILAGLIAIFPKGADESGASAVEVSAGVNSNVTFLSPNPLAYASGFNLHPGQSGSLRIVSQNYPFTRPPAILLASPPLTAGETETLGAFLESASKMELDFPASSAFSKMASEILFSPLPFGEKIPFLQQVAEAFQSPSLLQGESERAQAQKTLASIASGGGPLSKRVGDAALYSSFLRRAANYSQKNGTSAMGILLESEPIILSPTLGEGEKFTSLNDAISSLEQKAGITPGKSLLSSAGNGAGPSDGNQGPNGNNPAPSASSNPQPKGANYADSLFPAIPQRMEFAASEMQPKSEKELPLVSSVELGYPVAGFTGESPQSFSSRAISAGLKENKLAIAADISQEAINDDGVVGFDSKNADLQLKYFSLPDKTGTVPLTVSVQHQSLKPMMEFYGIDLADSDFTVGEVLDMIRQARQCNPLGNLAYPAVQPYRGKTDGTIYCTVLGADGSKTITSGYGTRVHPVTGKVAPHSGIDIRASEGTPIRASEAGVVEKLPGGACGLGILIDHGMANDKRLETKYCHTSQRLVTAGDSVTRGQVIGYVGHTGRTTGPHLHLEVKIDGQTQDPAPYYKACTTSLPASPQTAPVAPASAQPATASGLDQNGCVQGDFYAYQSALPFTPTGEWRTNIITTTFGGPGEVQDTTLGIWTNTITYYAGLPSSKAALQHRMIEVRGPSGRVIRLPVIDTGPFCERDDDYVFGNSRPFAEQHLGIVLGKSFPNCNKKYESTGAGLDISPAAAKEIGLGGKNLADWRFVQPP